MYSRNGLENVQSQWLRKLKTVQPQWLRKCKNRKYKNRIYKQIESQLSDCSILAAQLSGWNNIINTYLVSDSMEVGGDHISLPDKPRRRGGAARVDLLTMVGGEYIRSEVWTCSKPLGIGIRRETVTHSDGMVVTIYQCNKCTCLYYIRTYMYQWHIFITYNTKLENMVEGAVH